MKWRVMKWRAELLRRGPSGRNLLGDGAPGSRVTGSDASFEDSG